MNASNEQILLDLLKITSIYDFNNAIKFYDLQRIYERKRNYLLHKYFGGHNLKFATRMREIFNEFQNASDEQRAKSIDCEMYFLKKNIRLAKKHKQRTEYSSLVNYYNLLSKEYNRLNQGVNSLIYIYKKIHNAR